MPMGINFRVPELGGNALFKSLGDEMFQALRLFMHFIDRVIEYLIKKCLNKPVVTHHLQGSLLPHGG